jgi:phosphatidate cytidylyltransferase
MIAFPDLFWPLSARVLGLVAAGGGMAILIRTMRRGSATARASLWRRTAVWFAAAVAVLAVSGLGAVPWILFVGLMAFQASREVAAALRLWGHPCSTVAAVIGTWTPLLVPLTARTSGWPIIAVGALAAGAAVIATLGLRGIAGTAFTAVYVGIPLALLAALREHENGFALVIWILTVPSVTDVAAMYGGMLFGRHALAPRISPAKTIEGTLIGLAGSLAAAALFAFAFSAVPSPIYFGAAVAVGAAGTAGDLAASAMKRAAQIKDFGAALPGHGGVMDRIDGLLFAVPVAWLIFAFTPGW